MPDDEQKVKQESNRDPCKDAIEAVGEAVYCPHCDYDVRGATEDTCPECGKDIDLPGLCAIDYFCPSSVSDDFEADTQSLFKQFDVFGSDSLISAGGVKEFEWREFRIRPDTYHGVFVQPRALVRRERYRIVSQCLYRLGRGLLKWDERQD